MAIIFKDDGGDLLTDANLSNPYENASKHSDNILKMANAVQQRFDTQGLKNELSMRESNTAMVAADIMAGKQVDFASIDPGAVNGKELTDLMMKKTEFDATQLHQGNTYAEQVRANEAREAANVILQEDRQEIKLQNIAQTKYINETRRQAQVTKQDAQELKEEEFAKTQVGEEAAALLAESTSYLLSIKDPELRKKEANRIRKEFSADKENKAGILAGQQLFGETNRLVNESRASKLEDMDLALSRLADDDTAEPKRKSISKKWELDPRSSMSMYTPEGETIDKRNTMVVGSAKEKMDNIYDIAKYAANLRPATKMEQTIGMVMPQDTVDRMGEIRLGDRMLAVRSSTEAAKLETMVAGVVSDLNAAINGSTGAKKRRITEELVEFKRLVKDGTRSSAMKKKIKDFKEATKNLVYKPSNITKP